MTADTKAPERKTHSARITAPVPYLSGKGRHQTIPVGPCLVDTLGGSAVDIVWGSQGQRCVALPVEALEAAQALGHLVLLD